MLTVSIGLEVGATHRSVTQDHGQDVVEVVRDAPCEPANLAEVLMRAQNMIEVRLLHLEMKQFYSYIVEEQQ